jgi:hypothetical protein
VEQAIAEGDTVAVRSRASGRHTGPLGEVPASGRHRVTVSGTTFYRIESGKIAEDSTVFGSLGVRQQIRAVPETAAAGAWPERAASQRRSATSPAAGPADQPGSWEDGR